MALIFTAIVPNIDSYNYPFFFPSITLMFLLTALLPVVAAAIVGGPGGVCLAADARDHSDARDLCLNIFNITSVIST